MKQINYSGSSKLISRIVNLLNRKAPLPLDGDGDPAWGSHGQVLTTDGTGSTYWSAGGGSGDVTDVEVNGTSVVNAQGVAEVIVPTQTSDLNNDSDFIDSTDLSTALADYTPTANLATVATSGDYDDLTNKPSIPAAQIQSDWNQSDSTAVDYIKNKPTIPTDAQDIPYDNTQSGLTSTDVQEAIDELAQSGGGSIDIQRPTFTEATTRANIESGETISTLFGKIKKWFSDLSSMFVSKSGDTMSGNLTIDRQDGTTTAEGYSSFTLGNATPVGTNKNSTGLLNLYSQNAYPAVVYANPLTQTRYIGFPNKTGTVALTDDIPDISTKVSKSGDTMSGCLSITSTSDNFTEGVRINTASNGWFTLLLGGSGGSGTRDGAFWLGGNNTNYPRTLFIEHNSAGNSSTYFHASSSSDKSPKLHVPSGSIASGDGDAVTGNEVYLYIASGKSDRDAHNANNALKNGVYYYTSNGPATSLGASTTDGALYVQQYSDSWVAQIAQDYRNGRLFVRGKNNGTWTSWLRVALYTELSGLISSVSYSNGVLNVTTSGTTPVVTGTEINIVKSGKGTIEVQGASLASRLVLQSDYNLVLYKNGSAVWQSGTSSRRFKHNIQSMTEERARKILDVRAVTFDWNDGQPVTTQKCDNAGVIAEEVSQIIPDVVVFEQYDNDPNVRIERRVEYERFTPYLIKMVQMQQKQIDTMQATINALEQRLSKLEGN